MNNNLLLITVADLQQCNKIILYKKRKVLYLTRLVLLSVYVQATSSMTTERKNVSILVATDAVIGGDATNTEGATNE
jgi:hypothetical protein